jgi:hypothetical protein
MTYLAKPRSAVRVDLLKFNSLASVAVGSIFTVNDTPKNTSAVINASGYIELHNNSSWRLEANCMCQYSTTSSAYESIWWWYDGTSNLGNRGRMSNLANTQISRGSCSLLILSSEISTSITLYPRISNLSGAPSYDGTYTPLPHVRIYEIPN